MEAVPRLPMISFDLKISAELNSFAPKLKPYIAEIYHEDPESYSSEIRALEALRASAVRPVIDVTGCQTLKRYFCQLLFVESRFPMGKGDPAAITFSWRDVYANMVCQMEDIRFEMVAILYNIGALHTQLGATDSRTTSDGMKMACTHFQCAAWAFQYLRENFPQPPGVDLAPEVMLFLQEICLAQAQECILEKSMLDNRKATIIAKLAVKVVDYYNEALSTLLAGNDEATVGDIIGNRLSKEWSKYLSFKVAYHTSISFLYLGQQAEEQQKMGERVAFYNAASQSLENARKLVKNLDKSSLYEEAITFTTDVVEGKRKAATNENEFIYHEEVPDRNLLQMVQGVSLVRGIPFSFDDVEVSGPDIFARLIPIQAHEASSIYSEEKAELLRTVVSHVEEKDVQLFSYLTSVQTEPIQQAAKILLEGVVMTDLPQELVDRAAALQARPDAIKDLVQVMATLANIYHDVESMLEEIQSLLKEEEQREKEYQSAVGVRPPSNVSTELRREAAKYQEAHVKASESNQTLHRAMTLHVANLKLLALPLDELRQHIPILKLPDPTIDIDGVKELNNLVSKIDEMRKQRAMLVTQLRESVMKDDVTEKIVTKLGDDGLEEWFDKEMEKHQTHVKLIEQNLVAQDNILQAMTEAYARHSETRKRLHDFFKHRDTTIYALSSSYDAYDNLLDKANKGIEFYRKLETNVSKLLQRVKSTCKVQDEERESILAKNRPPSVEAPVPSSGPKLKDYLANMKRDNTTTASYYTPNVYVPPVTAATEIPPPVIVPSVRPAPVGSEGTGEVCAGVYPKSNFNDKTSAYQRMNYYNDPNNTTTVYPMSQNIPNYNVYSDPSGGYDPNLYAYNYYGQPQTTNVTATTTISSSTTEKSLEERMALLMKKDTPNTNLPSNSSGAYSDYSTPNMPYINASYSGYQAQNYGYQTGTDQMQPSPTPVQAQPPVVQSQPPVVQPQLPVSQTQHLPSQAQAMAAQAQPSQQVTPTHSQTPSTQAQTSQIPSNYTSYYPSHYQNYPTAVTPGGTPAVGNYMTYPTAGTPQYGTQANVQYYDSNATLTNTTPSSSLQYSPYYNTMPQYNSYSYPNSTSQPSTMTTTVSTTQNSQYSQYTTATATTATTTVSYPAAYNQNSNYPSGYYQYGYTSHPGYSFDVTTGQYQYTSGYQNAGYSVSNVTTDPNISAQTPTQYTNAGNYVTTQMTSQQYSQMQQGEPVMPGAYDTTNGYYYMTQYGAAYPNVDNTLQNPMTYMNASNTADTNMTQSQNQNQSMTSQTMPVQSNQNPITNSQPTQVSAPQSNIDLLADIDFNIPHEPLIPQNESFKVIEKEEEKKIPSPVPSQIIVREKEEEKSKPSVMPVSNESLTSMVRKQSQTNIVKKDPLDDAEILTQFTQEVEKFEKFVDGLTSKTLNGPTPLELKWKELQDVQDKEAQGLKISVARCYPMKNRFADVLPYDHSRVELQTAKDDYINASHIQNVTPHSTHFILTQAPLPVTSLEFWTMICEQQTETIVCLLNDSEITEFYWPREKGQDLVFGNMRLSLVNVNVKQFWIERTIGINTPESRTGTRYVMHLQFTAWPGTSFPTSPGPFIAFVGEIINFHSHQRSVDHPVVVHCDGGVGRSGLVCLLATYLTQPVPLPDVVKIVSRISYCRKQSIRDREHLRFAYQSILYHAQDLLMKRGVLTSRSTFDDSLKSNKHTRHPSQDLLLTGTFGGSNSNISQSSSDRPNSSIGHSDSKDSLNLNPQESGTKVQNQDEKDPLSSLDPLWKLKK